MKRFILPAAVAALAIGAASPSMAQVAIGDNARVTARGTSNSQVALALGTMATAHNLVGGITGATVTMGRNVSISTDGRVNSQVALALGTMATATNNVGGILAFRR